MRYLFFIATDPEPDTGDDSGELTIEQWSDTYGHLNLIGDRLRPAADATTVRKRGGRLVVTDGPFTESQEWIAGFDVIECDDLDAAIEIAAAHPMARGGRVEIRPLWPLGLR